MRNFIGQIHDTRKLTNQQIQKAEATIRKMLQLETVEIGQANGEFYPVSTNDSNIVDFKLNEYDNDKISLVKYKSFDDDMKPDPAGAILTNSDITCKD